jgi:Ca2+-binding EF-hand superfamily protein
MIFSHFDITGNGKITIKEFEKGLNALGIVGYQPAELEKIINSFDKTKKGYVSISYIY